MLLHTSIILLTTLFAIPPHIFCQSTRAEQIASQFTADNNININDTKKLGDTCAAGSGGSPDECQKATVAIVKKRLASPIENALICASGKCACMETGAARKKVDKNRTLCLKSDVEIDKECVHRTECKTKNAVCLPESAKPGNGVRICTNVSNILIQPNLILTLCLITLLLFVSHRNNNDVL